MIQKLILKNIQSHKDSEFNFAPGINCIVGSSNNGKSAVLRGLNWAIYNRPLGTDILLSNWAYDKKGKQIEEMSVEVEKDNSTLIRKKSATENSYYVNGEKLEAIKTDVPEQVERFFELSDTNVQKQMDQPFLLSLTSGQVAAYFNKVVRLDVIDKVLSNAESVRRKTKSKFEESEELVADYKKQLESFDWLDSVEKLIKKYENIESKKLILESEVEKLEEQLQIFESAVKTSNTFAEIIKNKKLTDKFEKLTCAADSIESEIEQLEQSVEKFNEISEKKFNTDFSPAKKLISKFEKSTDEVENIQNEVNHLGTLLANYDYSKNKSKEYENEIRELKEQLPKVCPLCGNPMNNGVCEND